MPHKERHRWVEEISKINKKINKQSGSTSSSGSSVGGLNLDFR
jgi:hypothetical protein